MSVAKRLLKEGDGVFRLKPTWVPRSFCRPGKRIKLHPDDYYVLGLEKGGIDERWFASTTWAENGPGTPADEGLSYAVSADGEEKILLRDIVAELKEEIIGEHLWNTYHGWSMFSKFSIIRDLFRTTYIIGKSMREGSVLSASRKCIFSRRR